MMTVDDAFNLISGGHVVNDGDLREILGQVYSEGFGDGQTAEQEYRES